MRSYSLSALNALALRLRCQAAGLLLGPWRNCGQATFSVLAQLVSCRGAALEPVRICWWLMLAFDAPKPAATEQGRSAWCIGNRGLSQFPLELTFAVFP